jgi:NADH dehydrogenase [ubiquinone] 1 alpha subcomplex assembly factor 7
MMADAALRSSRVPSAIDLHLVEINEQLHALQGQALAAYKPTWHARFDDVPEGPLLLVANEFFDALPVRQFERTARGWTERMVGLDDDGNLRLALAPASRPRMALPDAPVGAGRDL